MFRLRVLLLAAFLLLTQSGMLLHELDADHFGVAEHHCDICLSAKGLNGVLADIPDLLPAQERYADRLPQLIVRTRVAPFSAYRGRAPPVA